MGDEEQTLMMEVTIRNPGEPNPALLQANTFLWNLTNMTCRHATPPRLLQLLQGKKNLMTTWMANSQAPLYTPTSKQKQNFIYRGGEGGGTRHLPEAHLSCYLPFVPPKTFIRSGCSGVRLIGFLLTKMRKHNSCPAPINYFNCALPLSGVLRSAEMQDIFRSGDIVPGCCC